ncbi:cold-shock protein [Owenweeksia hongkongensis]|uniref:Cold shock protein n=1 Tax=Owenweeksia hongkongensis (strain DSM 17368 / CIP 108786 / JCM 12287 / NRRL B-23963 / UST20020801) TaxID=926562 RepID=G8R3E0_OWEHD|nr:cold shock domain-containing protein [Owenweeksia hongkongensis]AEV31961.1 cold shock protein [Owenweeksia hongkongensis DSM 17368]
MPNGKVKFFNDSKGYGFIVNDDTQQEIFVHVSGLSHEVREGDAVSFDEQEGKRGMNAVNVRAI